MSALADAALAVETGSGFTRRLGFATKRILDIAGAGFLLIALSPFLIATAILIRLDSPGPVVFSQERWGRAQTRVRIYKFRTMYADRCDWSGVQQTTAADSRITRIGHVLRRANIDELPQLYNVLKGDLSLVGPRCHPIGMRAGGVAYEELVPEYHVRHLIRPGITGWAQVHGLRGPTVDPARAVARIEYDLQYIARCNVFFDIWILALTIGREIGGGTGF